MAIHKWHPGKLIILWAWGGVLSALLLAHFESSPVQSAPFLHLFELVGSTLILIALSAVTWRWFGGRES
jgi:hypothetical protein